MEKIVIKNRKGQRVVVLVEEQPHAKGLAFVMHGLGGNKEFEHIATFAQAFTESGYTVVRFDTTNAFGESDGNFSDATTTNYYEDLEDVISWAKTQPWYQEPFCLAGHSLGGYAVARYAEEYPKNVQGAALISTFISGQLTLRRELPSVVEEWKNTGWLIRESKTRPGLIKRLKWSFAEDSLKHDLLPKASNLIMPILMIVGELDDGQPPEYQQLLFEKLPGKKEFHIIKGAPHSFVDPVHLSEIKEIFKKWIATL